LDFRNRCTQDKNNIVLPDNLDNPENLENLAKLYIKDDKDGAIGSVPVCHYRGIQIPC
jgi:hypothetical protein